MKARAQAADMALLDEGETTCCYARSEKHWVTDPQGIAWEQFHTLATFPSFSEDARASADDGRGLRPCGARATRAARTAGCVPTFAVSRGIREKSSSCC